jgi:hypothetical protein
LIAALPEAVWVLLADIDRRRKRWPSDLSIHATVGPWIDALLLRDGGGGPGPDQRVRLDRRPVHLHRGVRMNPNQQESDGATRVAYILGVPLAENVVRQWPQMGEIVRTSKLVADVEGNFPELTLEVGRRLRLDDVVVVEWTCNYGDGRLYRNVTIGELEDGEAVRVTDYWGEPTVTPEWRRPLTDRLEMAGDTIWPGNDQLGHY